MHMRISKEMRPELGKRQKSEQVWRMYDQKINFNPDMSD